MDESIDNDEGSDDDKSLQVFLFTFLPFMNVMIISIFHIDIIKFNKEDLKIILGPFLIFYFLKTRI